MRSSLPPRPTRKRIRSWLPVPFITIACGTGPPPPPPPANTGSASTATGGVVAAGGMEAAGGDASGGVAGVGGLPGGLGGEPGGGGGVAASGGMATGGAPPVTGGIGGAPGGTAGVGAGGGGAEGPVFDAGSAPDRNRVQPGAVCERLATIQCAGEAFCCPNPGRSFDQCLSAMRPGCVDDLYLDAISTNPVAGYSVDAAEGAFSRFEQLAAACDPTVAAWAASRNGLLGIALGTVAPGGSCKPPNVIDVRASAGYLAACTGGTACLPAGAFGNWTCVAPQNVGGNCFTDINCLDNLYCANPDLDPAGTSPCQQRKGDGTPCQLPNECLSFACRGGVCVPADAQSAYCLQ